MDIRPQLHGETVVHEYQVLTGFAHDEAGVVAERPAVTAGIGPVHAVQPPHAVLRGQRAHGHEPLQVLQGNGGFAAPHHRHAPVTSLDIAHRRLKIVEETGAGAGNGLGMAHVAEHIGIDEIRGHAVERQGHLLGGGAPPQPA